MAPVCWAGFLSSVFSWRKREPISLACKKLVRNKQKQLSQPHTSGFCPRATTGVIWELRFGLLRPFPLRGSKTGHSSSKPMTSGHLIVRLVRGELRLLVITCHAPTATGPSRQEWWQAFARQVLGLARGDQVVLLGDFNTRLLEPWQQRIGELLPGTGTGPAGIPFCLLDTLDLWIPATFSSCHEGWSHTWVSPGHETTSRIDYICVPSEWQCMWPGIVTGVASS